MFYLRKVIAVFLLAANASFAQSQPAPPIKNVRVECVFPENQLTGNRIFIFDISPRPSTPNQSEWRPVFSDPYAYIEMVQKVGDNGDEIKWKVTRATGTIVGTGFHLRKAQESSDAKLEPVGTIIGNCQPIHPAIAGLKF